MFLSFVPSDRWWVFPWELRLKARQIFGTCEFQGKNFSSNPKYVKAFKHHSSTSTTWLYRLYQPIFSRLVHSISKSRWTFSFYQAAKVHFANWIGGRKWCRWGSFNAHYLFSYIVGCYLCWASCFQFNILSLLISHWTVFQFKIERFAKTTESLLHINCA